MDEQVIADEPLDDAHDTAHIGYRFDRAYEILKACGFEYYTVFCGRTPELRKLF